MSLIRLSQEPVPSAALDPEHLTLVDRTGIFQLTSLIRLSLSHNKIKMLPEQCSRLTMLRHLDLDYNQIQVCKPTTPNPKHIHLETALFVFNPAILRRGGVLWYSGLEAMMAYLAFEWHNKIKTLPEQCSRLTMLRHLDLDYSQIQVYIYI